MRRPRQAIRNVEHYLHVAPTSPRDFSASSSPSAYRRPAEHRYVAARPRRAHHLAERMPHDYLSTGEATFPLSANAPAFVRQRVAAEYSRRSGCASSFLTFDALRRLAIDEEFIHRRTGNYHESPILSDADMPPAFFIIAFYAVA